MNKLKLKGVYFRPVYFQPTYQKGKDHVCGGVQLHVLNRKVFKPYAAGVYLLAAIKQLYPEKFEWKKPPYEYEYDKMPIDLIAGTSRLREIIDSGQSLKSSKGWGETMRTVQESARQAFALQVPIAHGLSSVTQETDIKCRKRLPGTYSFLALK